MLRDFLHSDEVSQVDNENEKDIIIHIGLATSGAVLYDIHPKRRMLLNNEEIFDLLTGRNRNNPDKPNEPHEVWKNIQRATATAKRPNGIKGSMKLLKRAWCPCLKKMALSFCSCPKCTDFMHNLRLYHKSRQSWHKIVSEKRKQILFANIEDKAAQELAIYPAVLDNLFNICLQCNANCAKGRKYQSFSTSARDCMATLLCPREKVDGLQMDKLDQNGNRTGEQIQFSLHKEECCNGTCFRRIPMRQRRVGDPIFTRRCGWNATLMSCGIPKHTCEEKDRITGDITKWTVHACPIEWTDDEFTWNEWKLVVRSRKSRSDNNSGDEAHEGAGEVHSQQEWLPILGTRKAFLCHLYDSFQNFSIHNFEVKFDQIARLFEERRFIVEPALRSNECPEINKYVATLQGDFSSVITAPRRYEQCCTFQESHQCLIYHAMYNPRLIPLGTLKDTNPRSYKRLQAAGVERYFKATSTVFFAMSKEKPGAGYDHTVYQDIIFILKHGCMHADSKGEAFINGARIPGSDKCTALPDGLVDVETIDPLFQEMQRVSRRRDGSKAQFQGKKAFRGMQTVQARLGIKQEDRRNPAYHGKCLSDCEGQVCSTYVHGSASDNYGAGTQNLIRHLAKKHPAPRRQRFTRHIQFSNERPTGLYSADNYVWMYYPDGFIDESITDTDNGYRGSSKDFFYASVGDSIETSNLKRRTRICPCNSCIEMKYDQCEIVSLVGRKPTNVNILAASPVDQIETRGVESLAKYCEKLNTRDYVLTRIASEDRNLYPNDQYFVATLEDPPRKLDEGGYYGTNHYRAGTWIVTVRWYNFKGEDGSGNRWYERLPAGNEQVMSCFSFIRGLNKTIALEYSRQKRQYKMSEELHSHILRYGNLAD